MDLPIIADLGDGWFLAAHPNGVCIANENVISTLWAPDDLEGPDQISRDVQRKAIDEFEKFAWTLIKAEFYPVDEDGDCRVCHEPKIIDTPSLPVRESPGDEVTDESAGTWLRYGVLAAIEDWRERYPDAPSCLVGGILESLASTWESELED
jgi:hypothetical protein